MAAKIEVVDASTEGVGDGTPEVHQVSVGTWTPKDGDGKPAAVLLRISAGAHHATARIGDSELLNSVIEALETNGDLVFHPEAHELEAKLDAEFTAMTPDQVDAALEAEGFDKPAGDRQARWIRSVVEMHNRIMASDREIEALRARLDIAAGAGMMLSNYVSGARAKLAGPLADPTFEAYARSVVETFGDVADGFDAIMAATPAAIESHSLELHNALEGLLPYVTHAGTCRLTPCDCGCREAIHAAEEGLA